MRFLSRLNFGRRPQALVSEQQIREFLMGAGGSHAVVTEASAMRIAAAWRCVNIIAGKIATLPLDLIRREDEHRRLPAVGHPLRRVLTVRPNQWQTPSEFRRMMQAHLLLRGNAYARKVMLGDRVQALLPLHPDRVQVEQSDTMAITYKVRRNDGGFIQLGQKDVLHLRGMSLDGVTGMSVIGNMREALGLALQAEQAGARLFKNGMLAGSTLTHPGRLSPNAHENLQRTIDEHSGSANAAKTMILEEGMKLEPIAMTAEDAQWLGARDFQRYDIAMFFGVPPHMIGATEKSTSWGSGIEQQNTGFVTYTLDDWFKTWEESIKRDLLPESEWESVDARFNVNGLLRGDVKGRWEAHVKALQWGVLSPDEVRALEDMNPRLDGQGNVYYDPPNTAGGDKEETKDEPAQTPGN